MIFCLAAILLLAPSQRPLAEHHLAKGQLAYQNKDYKGALAHFKKARALSDKLPSLVYWEALTRLKFKQLKKAEKLLLKGLAQNENPSAAFLKLLGKVQLELKKYSWAMRSLSGAVEVAPKDREARFLLAYVLVKLEEYDEAHKLLTALSATKQPFAREARLLLGIVAFRRRKLTSARKTLSLGLTSGPTGDLARRLLQVVLIKELGLKEGFGGSLLFTTGFDSNPALNASPDMGTVASKKGALANSVSAWFFYTPKKQLSVETSLKRSFYNNITDSEANDQVSSFNTTSLDLALFARHHYLDKGAHRRLEGAYLFSLLGLDGGDGIPGEPSFFLFSERHSLLLSYNRSINEKNSLEFSLTPSHTTFRDENRNGFGVTASIKGAHFFKGNRFKLFPMVYLGAGEANWDPWTSFQAGVWCGLSTVGPKKSDLTASLGYQAALFPHSHRATSPIWGLDRDTDRLDHSFTAALNLSKTFFSGKVRAGVSLSYLNQISTAAFFDYDRLVLSLSVSGRLDNTKEAR